MTSLVSATADSRLTKPCPAPLDFAAQRKLGLQCKVRKGRTMKLGLAHVPHTAATQFGTWVSYAGSARTVLALVLVSAAAIVVYLGFRLRLPFRPSRPGQRAAGIMLTAWVTAIAAFL